MPARALVIDRARVSDAPALAQLRVAVADALTERYGPGHWSIARRRDVARIERNIAGAIATGCVIVARAPRKVVATLTLQTRKPWAIDPTYFAPCKQPLYLIDMAVMPERQRQGIGRALLEEARVVARAWPADAIRLDAYDADAGAGAFYARCGFSEVGRVVYRGNPLIYYETRVDGPLLSQV